MFPESSLDRFSSTFKRKKKVILMQLFGDLNATQRAKFAEKVHKPPLWVNVINLELNGLDASIWIPWSPSDP